MKRTVVTPLLSTLGAMAICSTFGAEPKLVQWTGPLSGEFRVVGGEDSRPKPSAPPGGNRDPGEMVAVRGRVVTEDGGELIDAEVFLYSTTADGGSGGIEPLSGDGRFATGESPGVIEAVAVAKGYAPTLLPPRPAKAGQTLDLGDVILTRGRGATLQFVDVTGKPVRPYWITAGPSNLRWDMAIDGEPNEQGRVPLPHAAEFEHRISARAKGYQPIHEWNVSLPKEGEAKIVMTPARPFVGVVRDEDGRPAPNVELRVTLENYPLRSTGRGRASTEWRTDNYPFPGRLRATTDGDGRFTFDEISEGLKMNLTLRKAGQTRGVKLRVDGGAQPPQWTLEPAITVKGKLTGDLTLLGENGRTILGCVDCNGAEFGRNHVMVDADVQPDGSFELTDLAQGRLTIEGDGYHFEMDLTKSVDGIVIPLKTPR